MSPLILVIAAVGVAAAAAAKNKKKRASSRGGDEEATPSSPAPAAPAAPEAPQAPAPTGPQGGSLPLPINPFTGAISPHAFDALRGTGWPAPGAPKPKAPSTAQGTQGSPDRAHEQGGGGVAASLEDAAPEPDFWDKK